MTDQPERVSDLAALLDRHQDKIASLWAEKVKRLPDAHYCALPCVRIAYDNEKIIGFRRTVDDGQYYALIVDLVVDPKYQGRGIGTTILGELKDDLDGYIFTSLTAAIGKESFYQKQGWKKQVYAYFWPRGKKQEELYSNIGG
jgi:GNAT superfamily N-acetyltransferase